jgi:hypothetical protein
MTRSREHPRNTLTGSVKTSGKKNVCRRLEPKLKEAGFKVLNGGLEISFPSNGRQPEFHEKFPAILKRLRLTRAKKQPAGYVSRLLRLSSLAPGIITAIVNGKNPPQLTAKKLMRLALEIPVDWTAQRKLLGFHAR